MFVDQLLLENLLSIYFAMIRWFEYILNHVSHMDINVR